MLLVYSLQMEFYFALCSSLPEGTLVSPDVGAKFGSRGYVDFYVDGNLQYGIELTRDGAKLSQHLARFNGSDIYAAIPFKSWIVIDFRRKSVTQSKMKPGVLYVRFNRDFTSCSLLSTSLSTPQTLHLEGDSASFKNARDQVLNSHPVLSCFKSPSKQQAPSTNLGPTYLNFDDESEDDEDDDDDNDDSHQ